MYKLEKLNYHDRKFARLHKANALTSRILYGIISHGWNKKLSPSRIIASQINRDDYQDFLELLKTWHQYQANTHHQNDLFKKFIDYYDYTEIDYNCVNDYLQCIDNIELLSMLKTIFEEHEKNEYCHHVYGLMKLIRIRIQELSLTNALPHYNRHSHPLEFKYDKFRDLANLATTKFIPIKKNNPVSKKKSSKKNILSITMTDSIDDKNTRTSQSILSNTSLVTNEQLSSVSTSSSEALAYSSLEDFLDECEYYLINNNPSSLTDDIEAAPHNVLIEHSIPSSDKNAQNDNLLSPAIKDSSLLTKQVSASSHHSLNLFGRSAPKGFQKVLNDESGSSFNKRHKTGI